MVSGDVPEYPTALRRNRVSGQVAIELGLDRQGRVESTRVIRSDDEGLSEAAVQAVERWRFDPARSEGESTPFAFRILFTFDLQE
jgi:protein TonB